MAWQWTLAPMAFGIIMALAGARSAPIIPNGLLPIMVALWVILVPMACIHTMAVHGVKSVPQMWITKG